MKTLAVLALGVAAFTAGALIGTVTYLAAVEEHARRPL